MSERERLADRLKEIAPPGQAGGRERAVAHPLRDGNANPTDDEAFAEARRRLGIASDNGAGPQHGDDQDPSSWEPVDLARILKEDADPEPPPKMLARSDGECLLYAGKIHLFAGEPEGAKGWAAMK